MGPGGIVWDHTGVSLGGRSEVCSSGPFCCHWAKGPRHVVLGRSHLTKGPKEAPLQELSPAPDGPAQGCLSFPPTHPPWEWCF